MSAEATPTLERRISTLLRGGTWLSSAVIAIGLVLPSGGRVVSAGLALLVALPVVRVAVMLVEFVRRRDGRMVVIAALVLAVIALGLFAGVRMKTPGG